MYLGTGNDPMGVIHWKKNFFFLAFYFKAVASCHYRLGSKTAFVPFLSHRIKKRIFPVAGGLVWN